MKLRSLKTWSLFLLCIPALLLIASCGGGGGSSSGSPQAAPTTLTGKFIDAPVEGLTYVSGDVTTGIVTNKTDANGTFQYVQPSGGAAMPVTFKVGNLVIGTCIGKNIVTPVDLVGGTTLNDPRALNLVRFLLGIRDPLISDRIKINDNAHLSFPESGLLLNLSDTAMVNEMISRVPTAIVDSIPDPYAHFTSSMISLYSGMYQLTVLNENQDKITIAVDNNFNVSGSYSGFPITGTLNPVTGLLQLSMLPNFNITGAAYINGATGQISDGIWNEVPPSRLTGVKIPQ